MGLGMDDGDEYFCSLNVHSLVTQLQRKTVLHRSIATNSGLADLFY